MQLKSLILGSSLVAAASASPLWKRESCSAMEVLWGDLDGSPTAYEDPWKSITLPFAATLYGESRTTLWINLNGIIAFDPPSDEDYPSNDPQPLPFDGETGTPAQYIPPFAVAPFWMDLAIGAGDPSAVTYTKFLEDGIHSIELRWRVTTAIDSTPLDFTVYIDEDAPNSISFYYGDVAGAGGSASIGMQHSGTDGVPYGDPVNSDDLIVCFSEAADGGPGCFLDEVSGRK
jgi:hypothetical protein